MNEQLDILYRDIILDHYRSPRGKKPIERSDFSSEGQNPSCGDEIELHVSVKDDIVDDIHVDCRGCAISVASGSMLAEIVRGKTLAEIKKLAIIVKKMLKGEQVDLPEEFGDLDTLQGVRQFPVRIKCALLAWMTLLEGMSHFEKGDKTIASISTEDNN